jgi:Putative flagellar system-associated repeat
MKHLSIKRRPSRSLLLGALLGFLSVVVSASPAAAFAGGSGTVGDPYQISTCAQLLEIDDTTANLAKSYLVTANINCNGVTITPMKNGSTYFTGVLDGGNKTLSNLGVTCAAAGCGLFYKVTSGTVRDLTIAGSTLTTSAGYAGLLAGYLGDTTNTATVSNVAVSSANVTGTTNLGGLTGECMSCVLTDVSLSGSITGTNYVGGFAGSMGTYSASYTLRLTRAANAATIAGVDYVGGLVGAFSRSAYSVTNGVFQSSNSGTVTGSGQSVGGLVGHASGTSGAIEIANSYSDATVSAAERAGGIIGWSRGNSDRIYQSWSSGSVTSSVVLCSSGAGGIVGASDYGDIIESYSTASMSGPCRVGGIVGNNGYGLVSDVFFRGSLTRTSGTDASFAGVQGRGNGSITNSYAATTNSYAYGSGLSGDNQYQPACTSAYWDTSTSGRNTTYCAAGATGKTTAQLKTQATFSGWDFSTIWNIDPSVNSGYPYLRNVGGPSSDGTPPTLTSGELLANGTKLVLTFSEALHATTAPASAFTVTASAVLITPSAVVVNGSTVELTLPSALESSANITVAYVAPAANSATSNAAVQDSAGNDAASFSGRPVTNNSTADATPPAATWTAPSSPSSSRTLSYTLTFSESVTGIAAGDFSNLGNAAGCAFTPSAASTSTSITVSVTCTSDGTVIARLGSNTVVDAASNTGPPSGANASLVTINTTPASSTTTTPASSTTTTPASLSATTTLPAGAVSVTTTVAPATGASGAGGTSRTTTTIGTSASATTVPGTGVPSDPTTTTVAVSTTSTLPELDIPDTEVGGAAALIGGVRVEASITRENNELRVEVGPISARIWATSASGGKVPLDSTGRLRLQRGDSVTVDIEGFDANSDIEVRLYSEPVLLGRSKVGGSGTLAASYGIPEAAESGDHTVVLNGTGKGDDITLALSVAIGDEAAGISPFVIVTPIALAVLAALLVPVALRRRRRTVGTAN